jgi:hypothetical protein
VVVSPPVALRSVVPGSPCIVQRLRGNRGAAVNADQSVRGRRGPNRRVIDVHCTVHGGPRGFTNLVATKRDDLIELDPHAIGCVILLNEKAASELFDVLGEWLG